MALERAGRRVRDATVGDASRLAVGGAPSSETHSEGVMRASRFAHALAMFVEVGAPTDDPPEPGVDEVALVVPNRPVEVEADRCAVAGVVDVRAPADGVAAAPAAPMDVLDRRLLGMR